MSRTKTSSIISSAGNKIVLYTDRRENVELRVDVKKDTVWATLDQIADVFGRDKSVISRHLKNIFAAQELDRNSVVAKNATTAADGKTYIVEYYNLDAILSVGYRINSKRATMFRIWATRVLREYLINGFAIRYKKLDGPEQNFENLQEALAFMDSKSRGGPLKARMSLRLYKDVMK